MKNNNLVFEGIQVIGSGSFVQLPLVPSSMDSGFYCFQSQHFHMGFPHRITLDEVMHQDEQDLIQTINELCLGKPSPKTVDQIVIDEKTVCFQHKL